MLDWLEGLDGGSIVTTMVGLIVVAGLLLARRWRRFPSALLAVIVASLAALVFDLESHGVAIGRERSERSRDA